MTDQGAGSEQGRLVRDNLAFLLGLVPILVAMVRVAMAAQGDYGLVMTLVRTLDVQALIVGTFVRAIGLLLTAASGYVIVRLYVLRSDKATAPVLSMSLLPVFVVIFVIGVLATYREELLDTDKLTWLMWVQPVDLLRSVIWVFVVCLFVSFLSRHRNTMTSGLADRPHWRRACGTRAGPLRGNVSGGHHAASAGAQLLGIAGRVRHRRGPGPGCPVRACGDTAA